MTNKEWIESQNLSFAKGLKLWNKDKYPDFSEWLKTERTYKYKVGDVILYKPLNVKCVIIGVDVKNGKTGQVYPYNTIRIQPDGCIYFTSNENVKDGAMPNGWFDNKFIDDDPDYVKIA